jgi:hypothetical protein
MLGKVWYNICGVDHGTQLLTRVGADVDDDDDNGLLLENELLLLDDIEICTYLNKSADYSTKFILFTHLRWLITANNTMAIAGHTSWVCNCFRTKS